MLASPGDFSCHFYDLLRTCWVWYHWVAVWPQKTLFKMKWSAVKPKERWFSMGRSQDVFSLGTLFSVRHEKKKVPRPKLWSDKVRSTDGDPDGWWAQGESLQGFSQWYVFLTSLEADSYLSIHPSMWKYSLNISDVQGMGHMRPLQCVLLGLPV